MNDQGPDASHISQLVTQWSMLRKTASTDQEKAAEAQTRLVLRYQRAVYRYLLAALGDPHRADDAFQSFAMKVVNGKFAHTNPEKGLFRHYLKTSLKNLVIEYRRREARHAVAQNVDLHEAAGSAADERLNREFDRQWRDELLRQCWTALKEREPHSKQPLFAALHLKATRPDDSSEQLARLLSEEAGTEYSAATYRKVLQRARQSFAEILIECVADAVGHEKVDDIEGELKQLALMPYCKAVWQQRYPDRGK